MSENTALTLTDVHAAAQISTESWPAQRVRSIWDMAASGVQGGVTLSDFANFLATAERYDLDPMLGEIWLGKIQGKVQTITGRDSYIKVAQRDPGYQGFDADVVREADEFEIVRENDSIHITHKKGPGHSPIVQSYCVAYHDGRRPVVIQTFMAEVKHLAENGKTAWPKNLAIMLLTRSVTKALALQYNISGVRPVSDVGDDRQPVAAAPSSPLNVRVEEEQSNDSAPVDVPFEVVSVDPVEAPDADEVGALVQSGIQCNAVTAEQGLDYVTRIDGADAGELTAIRDEVQDAIDRHKLSDESPVPAQGGLSL